jgi:hypothetical protein
MNYTHLTHHERYQIYILKKAGHNPSAIAPRRPATTDFFAEAAILLWSEHHEIPIDAYRNFMV